MRKTRKYGFGKRKHVRQKHKSKRLGRGREDVLPILISKMLDTTSLHTNKQHFVEPGLVSHILKDIPRALVTHAIRKADVTKKLENAKITLDAYITKTKPIHDNYEQVNTYRDLLEDERDKVEDAIEYSKLEEYNNLKTKYDDAVTRRSSYAYVLKIRFDSIRCCGLVKKLDILNNSIDKAIEVYDKAYTDHVTAYEEQDNLTINVRNLERELEELLSQESLLNRAQGKRKNK